MRSMEKKAGLILGGIFLFSLVLVGFVMADTTATQTASAKVTVNTFVDITLAQCPGTGNFDYGSLDPVATVDTPISCQDNIGDDGALRLTVQDTTNKPVNIEIKGTDYIGSVSGSIPVGNTEYEGIAPKTGGAVTLTVSFVQVFASVGGTGSAIDKDLWFYLDMPSTFLAAGDYTSTYTLKAS